MRGSCYFKICRIGTSATKCINKNRMKLNIILTVIAALVVGLLVYWIHTIIQASDVVDIMTYGSGVCFLVTLLPVIGIQYESARLGINIRIVSTIFFVAFLVSQFSFANFASDIPLYIIVNGLLLIIFLLVLYKMQSIKNI